MTRQEAREHSLLEEGFKHFMSQPLTRMAISSIPSGDQTDALQMLLRAAFKQGFNSGEGAFALTLLKDLMAREKERDL